MPSTTRDQYGRDIDKHATVARLIEDRVAVHKGKLTLDEWKTRCRKAAEVYGDLPFGGWSS